MAQLRFTLSGMRQPNPGAEASQPRASVHGLEMPFPAGVPTG
jgi:hypothetical protein